MKKGLIVGLALVAALAIAIASCSRAGDADTVVPIEKGKELVELTRSLGQSAEMVVYPGADHSLQAEGHDHLREFLRGAGQGIASGRLD